MDVVELIPAMEENSAFPLLALLLYCTAAGPVEACQEKPNLT